MSFFLQRRLALPRADDLIAHLLERRTGKVRAGLHRAHFAAAEFHRCNAPARPLERRPGASPLAGQTQGGGRRVPNGKPRVAKAENDEGNSST